MNKKFKKIYSMLPWGLFVIACCVIAFLLFFNVHISNQNNSSQDASETIALVGKLMLLPSDETPTVATVTNLSELKGQPFFADAAVGDKVLIYTKAGKAILYDPTLNKIIALAPINTSATSSNQ